MIKVTPVHKKIVEVAREFDENSCGGNLFEMVENIKRSPHPNQQIYNKLYNDSLLVDSAKSLGVGPGSEYTFFDFLASVAKAQLHVSREEREYSYFHKAIIENYPKEIRKNVAKEFLEIAETFPGIVEKNFINFIIDTLDEVKSYKQEFHSFYSAPNVPAFLKNKLNIHEQIVSGDSGFVFFKDTTEYKRCIELLEMATH